MENEKITLKELKTKVGTFYLGYADYLNFLCVLLDSNKKLISYIYPKEAIKKLKKINTIDELINILDLEYCIYGQSIEQLNDKISKYRNNHKDLKIQFSIDNVNKVGDTYFIIEF